MNQKIESLKPDDIIPGDPVTTVWRLCVKNGWSFVPDFVGGDHFVDLNAVAYMLGIAKHTIQNHYMRGIPLYANGMVRLSEVMRRKETKTGGKP